MRLTAINTDTHIHKYKKISNGKYHVHVTGSTLAQRETTFLCSVKIVMKLWLKITESVKYDKYFLKVEKLTKYSQKCQNEHFLIKYG